MKTVFQVLVAAIALTFFPCCDSRSDLSNSRKLQEILNKALVVKMTALEVAELQSIHPTSYSGWIKIMHPNGQVAMLAYCENDVIEGTLIEWYESGQKKQESHYYDRQHVGSETYWHENGQKSGEGRFKNGEQDGKFVTWYESGQKESESNYVNGNRHGQAVGWHENGQMSHQSFYKDGKLDSVSKRWDQNGRLESMW